MKITIADFRACGICPHARHWFAKHGLDWRSFTRNGIEASALRATGEFLAKIDQLEAHAEARRG